MNLEECKDALTVFEQNSVRFEGSRVLYFDPFHVPDREAKRDADFVFLTHDHFDHYSPSDIRKVRNEHTIFLLPEPMVSARASLGLDDDHVILMRPGDRRILFDVEILAVPAYNVGKPFHPKASGWLGYLVRLDDVSLYVAGDTDDIPEARELRPDVLCVPIGGTYTMDASQAAAFAKELRPKAVVPTHYGTVVGTPDMLKTFKESLGGEIPVWEKLSF